MITRSTLRALRNDLPMTFTFRQLGEKAPYAKDVEGRFRFETRDPGARWEMETRGEKALLFREEEIGRASCRERV